MKRIYMNLLKNLLIVLILAIPTVANSQYMILINLALKEPA
ncbi:MAG: hypothetical protein RAP41_08920 [Candidatus Orphnella occulta]|nr:hypothetical protein [Candidatus Orphnella occulta]